MNNIIQQMLLKHKCSTIEDKESAIRETIQEITLCCLSKIGFFKKIAFFGGTALRLFYDLPRYSEDLDFVLINKDNKFNLDDYLPKLEKMIKNFGIDVKIVIKKKTNNNNIKTAYIKGNAITQYLTFFNENIKGIDKKKLLSIKLEIDVEPTFGASYEIKYKLSPSPYEVVIYDLPSLFAIKINAILTRQYKTNVKGRDLYDYLFYLTNNVKPNLYLLKNKLLRNHLWNQNKELTDKDICGLLINKFKTIDYELARSDIQKLIFDKKGIELWSKDFFVQITKDYFK